MMRSSYDLRRVALTLTLAKMLRLQPIMSSMMGPMVSLILEPVMAIPGRTHISEPSIMARMEITHRFLAQNALMWTRQATELS